MGLQGLSIGAFMSKGLRIPIESEEAVEAEASHAATKTFMPRHLGVASTEGCDHIAHEFWSFCWIYSQLLTAGLTGFGLYGLVDQHRCGPDRKRN